MRRVLVLWLQAFTAAVLTCALSPAFGAVFTVAPGSSLTLSGDLSLQFSGAVTASGSGSFVEQAPGSLTSSLSGVINANTNGSTLSFVGGNITAKSSGNWQPSGLPAAFGFQANIPLSGGLSGTTIQFVGDGRDDFTFNATGNAALSGAPGNQTFDTNGLALTATNGTFDFRVSICNVAGCTELTTFSTVAGPPPDILPSGTGTFTRVGAIQDLSFPIALKNSESDSQTETGVTVAVSLTLNLDGQIAASSPIPEPSTGGLLFLGLGGIALAYHRRHRRI